MSRRKQYIKKVFGILGGKKEVKKGEQYRLDY